MDKINNSLIQPEDVLKQLDLHNNMRIADFGCGNGYFSVPMAKINNQGQVFALDVIKEALEAVISKANLEGVKNIKTVHCNLEILGSSKLDDESIDLVLMRNILFQSQKKSEILKEAKRVLKSDGRLVLLEWAPGASMAPKEGWLIGKDEVKRLAQTEKFSFEKELALDNQHYGLIFKNSV